MKEIRARTCLYFQRVHSIKSVSFLRVFLSALLVHYRCAQRMCDALRCYANHKRNIVISLMHIPRLLLEGAVIIYLERLMTLMKNDRSFIILFTSAR